MITITKQLKIKLLLTSSEQDAINRIDELIISNISSSVIAEDYIGNILNLLHVSLSINPTIFVEQIFFEFYLSLKKVSSHKERIYNELGRVGEFSKNSVQEKAHLVNIYRNLISDLFDPYMSIFVACLQLQENKFVNFICSNLGQGEINKYEYSFSKLKPTNLFEGYNSIVRNAISHAGTDSIIYEENEIIFKNIKRGDPPVVTYVKWTSDELQKKIIALLDLVHAIDASVEIFGIDIGDIIKSNELLYNKFLADVINVEKRIEIQDEFNSLINKINGSKLSEKEKLDTITNIFFIECHKRSLQILAVKFKMEERTVFIEIPDKVINSNNADEQLERIMEVIRYGIIAEPCYSSFAEKYVIQELTAQKEKIFTIIGKAEYFKSYAQENLGMVDLLHELTVYLKEDKLDIVVDFNAIQEQEYKGLGKIFPRMKR